VRYSSTASRGHYVVALVAILLAGVVSRLLRTGQPLIDKYLGDALYATMVYLLLCIAWKGGSVAANAALAGAIMLAIETFQLTGIPARLARSEALVLRLLAVALGTGFSWRDLAAYAVGIALVALLDAFVLARKGDSG
jgi:hypothetical protein